MDLKRILTTLLGLPIVAAVFILCNKYVIDVLLMIIAIMCMHEYLGVIKKVSHPNELIAYASTIIIGIAAFLTENEIVKISIYAIPFIVLLLFLKVITTDMKSTFKDVAYTLLGIAYIVVFILFLALIRALPNGQIIMGFVAIVAWETDIFAYLVGRQFGKHKFSKVSPKKSIEGCIAGMVGAMAVSCVYMFVINNLFNTNYSIMFIAIISIILSIISQIGDFTASSIKRFADVKDYGNILPGHGGMLDRIDSLIFIAPFAYMIFTLIL